MFSSEALAVPTSTDLTFFAEHYTYRSNHSQDGLAIYRQAIFNYTRAFKLKQDVYRACRKTDSAHYYPAKRLTISYGMTLICAPAWRMVGEMHFYFVVKQFLLGDEVQLSLSSHAPFGEGLAVVPSLLD